MRYLSARRLLCVSVDTINRWEDWGPHRFEGKDVSTMADLKISSHLKAPNSIPKRSSLIWRKMNHQLRIGIFLHWIYNQYQCNSIPETLDLVESVVSLWEGIVDTIDLSPIISLSEHNPDSRGLGNFEISEIRASHNCGCCKITSSRWTCLMPSLSM